MNSKQQFDEAVDKKNISVRKDKSTKKPQTFQLPRDKTKDEFAATTPSTSSEKVLPYGTKITESLSTPIDDDPLVTRIVIVGKKKDTHNVKKKIENALKQMPCSVTLKTYNKEKTSNKKDVNSSHASKKDLNSPDGNNSVQSSDVNQKKDAKLDSTGIGTNNEVNSNLSYPIFISDLTPNETVTADGNQKNKVNPCISGIGPMGISNSNLTYPLIVPNTFPVGNIMSNINQNMDVSNKDTNLFNAGIGTMGISNTNFSYPILFSNTIPVGTMTSNGSQNMNASQKNDANLYNTGIGSMGLSNTSLTYPLLFSNTIPAGPVTSNGNQIMDINQSKDANPYNTGIGTIGISNTNLTYPFLFSNTLPVGTVTSNGNQNVDVSQNKDVNSSNTGIGTTSISNTNLTYPLLFSNMIPVGTMASDGKVKLDPNQNKDVNPYNTGYGAMGITNTNLGFPLLVSNTVPIGTITSDGSQNKDVNPKKNVNTYNTGIGTMGMSNTNLPYSLLILNTSPVGTTAASGNQNKDEIQNTNLFQEDVKLKDTFISNTATGENVIEGNETNIFQNVPGPPHVEEVCNKEIIAIEEQLKLQCKKMEAWTQSVCKGSSIENNQTDSVNTTNIKEIVDKMKTILNDPFVNEINSKFVEDGLNCSKAAEIERLRVSICGEHDYSKENSYELNNGKLSFKSLKELQGIVKKPKKYQVPFRTCSGHEHLKEFQDEYSVKKGFTFVSVQAFNDYVNKHALRWLFRYKCTESHQSSGRQPTVVYNCVFRKYYFPEKCYVKRENSRKRKEPFRTNCPCKIVLRAVEEGKSLMKVAYICNHHDHPLTEELLRSVTRFKHLSNKVKEEVRDLLYLNAPVRLVQKYLYEMTTFDISDKLIYHELRLIKRSNIGRQISPARLKQLCIKIKALEEKYGPGTRVKKNKKPVELSTETAIEGQDDKDDNKNTTGKLKNSVQKRSKKRKTDEHSDSVLQDSEEINNTVKKRSKKRIHEMEVDNTNKRSRLEERLENISYDKEVLESVRKLQESVRGYSDDTQRAVTQIPPSESTQLLDRSLTTTTPAVVGISEKCNNNCIILDQDNDNFVILNYPDPETEYIVSEHTVQAEQGTENIELADKETEHIKFADEENEHFENIEYINQEAEYIEYIDEETGQCIDRDIDDIKHVDHETEQMEYANQDTDHIEYVHLDAEHIAYKDKKTENIEYLDHEPEHVEYADQETEHTQYADKKTEYIETHQESEFIEYADSETEIIESTDKETEIIEYADEVTEYIEYNGEETEHIEYVDQETEHIEYVKQETEHIEYADQQIENIECPDHTKEHTDQGIEYIEYTDQETEQVENTMQEIQQTEYMDQETEQIENTDQKSQQIEYMDQKTELVEYTNLDTEHILEVIKTEVDGQFIGDDGTYYYVYDETNIVESNEIQNEKEEIDFNASVPNAEKTIILYDDEFHNVNALVQHIENSESTNSLQSGPGIINYNEKEHHAQDIGIQTDTIYTENNTLDDKKAFFNNKITYIKNDKRTVTEEYITRFNIHQYITDKVYKPLFEYVARDHSMSVVNLLSKIYNTDAIKVVSTKLKNTKRVLTLLNHYVPKGFRDESLSELEKYKADACMYFNMIKSAQNQMETNLSYAKEVSNALAQAKKENSQLSVSNTNLRAHLDHQCQCVQKLREETSVLKKKLALMDINFTHVLNKTLELESNKVRKLQTDLELERLKYKNKQSDYESNVTKIKTIESMLALERENYKKIENDLELDRNKIKILERKLRLETVKNMEQNLELERLKNKHLEASIDITRKANDVKKCKEVENASNECLLLEEDSRNSNLRNKFVKNKNDRPSISSSSQEEIVHSAIAKVCGIINDLKPMRAILRKTCSVFQTKNHENLKEIQSVKTTSDVISNKLSSLLYDMENILHETLKDTNEIEPSHIDYNSNDGTTQSTVSWHNITPSLSSNPVHSIIANIDLTNDVGQLKLEKPSRNGGCFLKHHKTPKTKDTSQRTAVNKVKTDKLINEKLKTKILEDFCSHATNDTDPLSTIENEDLVINHVDQPKFETLTDDGECSSKHYTKPKTGSVLQKTAVIKLKRIDKLIDKKSKMKDFRVRTIKSCSQNTISCENNFLEFLSEMKYGRSNHRKDQQRNNEDKR